MSDREATLEALVDELAALIKRTRTAINAIPEWIYASGTSLDFPDAGELSDALERVHGLRPPKALADIFGWFDESPAKSAHYTWQSIGGEAAMGTNGHACLVVDRVPDAPTASVRWETPEAAAAALQHITPVPRRAGRVLVDDLRRAAAGDFFVVGRRAFFSDLVRKWVLLPADLSASAEITVGFASEDERDPVLWQGAGWRAVTMPTLSDANDRAKAVVLDLREVGR